MKSTLGALEQEAPPMSFQGEDESTIIVFVPKCLLGLQMLEETSTLSLGACESMEDFTPRA